MFSKEYEELCPYCDYAIGYERVFGEKELNLNDYKRFECPECGKMILPCDLCYDLKNHPCINGGDDLSFECPLEKKTELVSHE